MDGADDETETPSRQRWLALGGVVGPVAFIGTWLVLGVTRDGYSPVDDPISRLAAVDASTRVPMTVAFIAFAIGVGAFAAALRDHLPASTWAAATTAIATLGVAAFPLDASFGDDAHAAMVAVAYSSLAAMPLLAARTFAATDRGGEALVSTAVSAAVVGALVGSVVVSSATGLFQRTGLIVGDAWIVIVAVWLIRIRERAEISA